MKYHGPVRFVFKGKKENCSKYTGRARLYLQQAITRMGPDKAAWNRTEPDGTTIRISSFSSGYNVEITCKGDEEILSCASGFYLEPKSDEAPLGFRPNKTPIEAGDGFFPGITVEDGKITKESVELGSALQPYTLDWTSPQFDEYLVWPAVSIRNGTDDNSIIWSAFHRYICAPATGKLYYCNTEHSGGPGGLALGYGVRLIGKKSYLYCASTTVDATIKIHRRVWLEEPYLNDDPFDTVENPFGWEYIGEVTDITEAGYSSGKWSSGAYWNPSCSKFVICVHRDTAEFSGGGGR